MNNDDDIIKGYDPTVFKRIISYIRPYRITVLLALIALTVATASELVTPVILQRALDGTILREYRRIPLEERDDETAQRVLSADPGENIGGYVYVGRDALSEITRKRLEQAEASGVIEKEAWYVFEVKPDTAGIIEKKPELFTLEEDRAAIRSSDLGGFNEEDIKNIRSGDIAGLKKLGLVLLGILFAGLVASFFQVYLMAYTGQSVMIDLRVGLFSHLLTQALAYLTKKPVGSLVTRATNDVETVNELFAQVATSLLRDLTIMAGVLAALYILNTRLAVITTFSLPPVIILTLVFRVKARDAYRRVRRKVSAINTFLSEHISGMEVVQMFAREKESYRDYERGNRELLEANLGEMYVFATFRPLVDLLASVSVGVVLYGGASLFGGGSISIGVLIAFVNLIEKFYQPLKDISEQFTIMQSAMAGGERVLQTLDEEVRIPWGHEPLDPASVKGRIEFDGVSFAYNPGEPVLRNVSLAVGEGETAALVGYTGAGKTTVANLITRLWDIQEGSIWLDGRNIRTLTLDSLRRAIQPVDQDVFLFSGTIAENIRLGKPLDDAVLEDAAKAVFLHDYIESLPGKYQTEISEGGANLSSGQRQLLSFARVIAHDPKVLILDEATASIDTHTERLVQAALKKVLKGRTSLVIAHRLSTIRDADRIFVLSGGRLVEEGSHDELIARQGAYYNLYRLQYG